MKKIILTLLLVNILFANDLKTVYFYTTDTNINNFKSLKISFDRYLSQFGNYTFQPFNNQKTFEKYLSDKNAIVILSSWHYQKIAKEYNLKAILVAQKKGTITDRKILVGKRDINLKGVIASAYDKKYTKELLTTLTKDKKFSILIVPKEIDALMSVGFGMSNFAIVSKDSLELLKQINPALASSLHIYEKSSPKYRMLIACKDIDETREKIMEVFTQMYLTNKGEDILNSIGVDKLLNITKQDLKNIEDSK